MPTPPHRDPLAAQNAALVERVVLLRTALKGLSEDHASVHRQLTRARVENQALKAALVRGGVVPQLRSARRPREIAPP
jgi:hypothetical protein